MTAKYGIPYFANFINSDMDPEDARSMCCRLRLDNRELRRRGGGLFGSNPLTGSIGVVTLNLPRAAYLADGIDEPFSPGSPKLMRLGLRVPGDQAQAARALHRGGALSLQPLLPRRHQGAQRPLTGTTISRPSACSA